MTLTDTREQSLAAPSSDERLYCDRPAFIRRDQHEVIDGILRAVDPVQYHRGRKGPVRVVVGDVALVLKFHECAGETPYRLGEHALVLLEVTLRIAVFNPTIDTSPSMPTDPVLRRTDQAISIAGCVRVKHGVVSGAHSTPQGVFEGAVAGVCGVVRARLVEIRSCQRIISGPMVPSKRPSQLV